MVAGPRRPSFKRSAVIAALFAATAVVPSAALADDSPPSVDQYVENVPTAAGAQASGWSQGNAKKLPVSIRRRITEQAGSDARVLNKIATSPTYGAPGQTPKAQKTQKRSSAQTVAAERALTLNQPSSSANGRFIGLGAVLLVALVAAGLSWRLRRR
jgi:hypothetical protein